MNPSTLRGDAVLLEGLRGHLRALPGPAADDNDLVSSARSA